MLEFWKMGRMLTIFAVVLLSACDRVKESLRPKPQFTLFIENDWVRLNSADTSGIEIDVLQNDLIGDTALVSLEKRSSKGYLSMIKGRKTLFYKPKKFYAGYDTASYRVCIRDSCKTAFIYFTIADTLNIAQIYAMPDTLQLIEGARVELDVLANDILKGNTVLIATLPSGLMKGNRFFYTYSYPFFKSNPSQSEFYNQEFEYIITASALNYSESFVKIRVIPDCTGKRFQAKNDTILLNTTAYSAFTNNLIENDSMCAEDRNRLTIRLISPTRNGTLFFDNSIFSFTTNQLQNDSFEYEICLQPNNCRRAKVYFVPKP